MWVVILNTLVSIAGAMLGSVIASASVVGITNLSRPVPWGTALLVAAYGISVLFIVSGIGAWVMYWLESARWVRYLIALPWVYLILFISALLYTILTD